MALAVGAADVTPGTLGGAGEAGVAGAVPPPLVMAGGVAGVPLVVVVAPPMAGALGVPELAVPWLAGPLAAAVAGFGVVGLMRRSHVVRCFPMAGFSATP